MKKIYSLLLASSVGLFPLTGMALQNGLSLSYGTDAGSLGEPSGIMGGGINYLMQPDSWQWGHFSLGFNFSYGFWKTTDYPDYQTLSIYAVAPEIRWSFLNNAVATPFLVGSFGGAVLSADNFGDRQLGSQVLFQSRGGFGFTFGSQQKIYASLEVMHYSDASITKNNGGVTIPLLFSVGALF